MTSLLLNAGVSCVVATEGTATLVGAAAVESVEVEEEEALAVLWSR